MNAFDELCQKLETILSEHDDQEDASHGIYHARRVLKTALQIAKTDEAVDKFVLAAAAYLHDLVNLPKNHPDRAQASRLSARAAVPLLQNLGLGADQVAATCHAIEAHSFSANITPETIEAKILQDADRLEALGAIGIARTFYISGALNRALFDGADPLAKKRPLDDTAYTLDHFEIKLLKLAGTMQTDMGRMIAQERTDFMQSFVDQIALEA